MGLDSLVRKGVAIAAKVTKSLRVDVVFEPWTGVNITTSAPNYGTKVALSCFVEYGPIPFIDENGDTISVKAKLSILEPIPHEGTEGREEPIDPRDKFTLPNGTVGHRKAKARGFVDPVTGDSYYYIIGLGEGPGG